MAQVIKLTRVMHPILLFVAQILCVSMLLFCESSTIQHIVEASKPAACKRLYVFGDSYSDIGEGYLDGNGPTAAAYLAERLGLRLVQSNAPNAREDSLDFAISGAGTGQGSGATIGDALLGVGMRTQVNEFAMRVQSHEIQFEPESTIFLLAGGLNDDRLPTQKTITNLKNEIRILYRLGGRRFVVALLPTAIPEFGKMGKRLNAALSCIPHALMKELPGSKISMSRWGLFFDEVLLHPAKYGIRNTTAPCAGRALFHQDPTPCSSPNTHFYYHEGHPSTAVHKIVGDKVYEEMLSTHAL